MSASCTHTLQSGLTCKSPAVRNTSLCFNHTPHETIKRRQPHDYEAFELPPLRDKNSVLVAISEVLHRLSMRRIKRSEAGTLIHGLSIVARLMTEIDQAPAEYPIGFDEMQSVAPSESEPSLGSIEELVNSITSDFGGPTFKEIQELRESMPDATPEQALQHWIAAGKVPPQREHAMPSKHREPIHIAAHASSPSAPSVHS